ncbi:ABC transporter substrate-binding protein [Suttonella sp. R2A3]|uniref:ABC transporter substrate-binding protein n=1 Tax=Suttonella sp. R2A3 TaxID=2908648 RepID=UPI001F2DD549|nr:ABC transporter substrate-binding protein [Suttonella sp. R2A3]UJF23952.1 ABC transporter substrate-binding protein [Suttonella sp. R2A3]
MLSRRRFNQFALASASAAALSPVLAQNASPITLWGPPVAPTALLSLAAQDEALQEVYPGISAKTWATPDQLRAGLANGEMPLVMVPSYVAANFRNQGRDVGLLNIMTFGLLYVIGKDDSVNSLEDLIGKTLVMPFKQDMPDLVLQTLLAKAGIDQDQVTIQYTSTPPEALMLFLSGKADVALLPEPAVSMAQIKAKGLGMDVQRRLNIQELWGSYMETKARIPQAGLMVTREFYETQQPFLQALHQPLQRALNLCDENPQLAAERTADILKAPVPVMAASIPQANLTITHASEISEEILEFFDVLYQLNPKILGGKAADSDLIWSMPA